MLLSATVDCIKYW